MVRLLCGACERCRLTVYNMPREGMRCGRQASSLPDENAMVVIMSCLGGEMGFFGVFMSCE